MRVVPADEASVIVAWRPIAFRGFAGEDGRYVVSVANSPGGPFEVAGETSDPEGAGGKEINQLLVAGVGTGSRSFRVEAVSDPHPWNQNQVTSLPIANVTVFAVIRVEGTIFTASASTNAAGNYTITGLPTGSYRLLTSNSQGFINEIYDNQQCRGSCSSTTAVSIGRPPDA